MRSPGSLRSLKKVEKNVSKRISGSYTLLSLTDERALKEAGVVLSPWTLRQWRKTGRHPELFVKVGRRVFLVLENWQKLVEKGVGK
jgi:hypothetical protein